MAFRVSLKMAANPILLHDGPKEMRVLRPWLGVASGGQGQRERKLVAGKD